jgi:hypothetical protein
MMPAFCCFETVKILNIFECRIDWQVQEVSKWATSRIGMLCQCPRLRLPGLQWLLSRFLSPVTFCLFFYFYNDFFALKFETAPFLSFSPEKVLWQINSLITHGFQGPKRWRSNLRRILAQAGKGESRDKPFRTHGFWSQPSEAFCIVLLTSSPFLCRFQDVSSESVV